MDVIIYHNPDCGTSRNVLGIIRNAGIEPHVVEYLKTPPARALLDVLPRLGIGDERLEHGLVGQAGIERHASAGGDRASAGEVVNGGET